MSRITHAMPSLVWYVDYEGVTIKEALLNELRIAPHNTLTLPQINHIRVNGNSIVGSYGHCLMELNREGYHIVNHMTPIMNKNKVITQKSEYVLMNPFYNPGSFTSNDTNF